ncbi:hypothetical protein HQQ81_07340 [Microbacteriaceae bacterium VKM Ac-2854]|nr:hypothetical protein [Microbacteriaceae bacterium VKM Ac-2854]
MTADRNPALSRRNIVAVCAVTAAGVLAAPSAWAAPAIVSADAAPAASASTPRARLYVSVDGPVDRGTNVNGIGGSAATGFSIRAEGQYALPVPAGTPFRIHFGADAVSGFCNEIPVGRMVSLDGVLQPSGAATFTEVLDEQGLYDGTWSLLLAFPIQPGSTVRIPLALVPVDPVATTENITPDAHTTVAISSTYVNIDGSSVVDGVTYPITGGTFVPGEEPKKLFDAALSFSAATHTSTNDSTGVGVTLPDAFRIRAVIGSDYPLGQYTAVPAGSTLRLLGAPWDYSWFQFGDGLLDGFPLANVASFAYGTLTLNVDIPAGSELELPLRLSVPAEAVAGQDAGLDFVYGDNDADDDPNEPVTDFAAQRVFGPTADANNRLIYATTFH